jgi:hypothetical protein
LPALKNQSQPPALDEPESKEQDDKLDEEVPESYDALLMKVLASST